MVVLQEVVPDLFFFMPNEMRAYSFRVWISLHMALCAQSFLVSNRVALWDGRSLTLSVESKQGRVSVSGPAHHTDTLLLSIFSQAEHEWKEKRHTQTGNEKESKERFFTCGRRARWAVDLRERSVFGRLQGSGRVCVCTAGGTVCPCVQSQQTFLFFKKCFDCIERWRRSSSTSSNADVFLNENLVFKNNSQTLKIRSLLYLYYFKLLYNLMTFVLHINPLTCKLMVDLLIQF